jgi:aromatic-L-amino-acid/L-tryptophan decarboxylase
MQINRDDPTDARGFHPGWPCLEEAAAKRPDLRPARDFGDENQRSCGLELLIKARVITVRLRYHDRDRGWSSLGGLLLGKRSLPIRIGHSFRRREGNHMDNEDFRRASTALADALAEYRAKLASRELPVLARVKPGQVAAALPATAPEMPESFEAVLNDVRDIILPGITHWQHPRFFGYFPTGGDLSSVLGDMLSTGLGVVGLNWQASPALTELETVTVRWLRDLLGLSMHWHGSIQDYASTATLLALLSARERSTDYSASRGGLQAAGAPLIIYTTAEAHSSVMKAAALAGFGRDNLRSVPVDAKFAMDAGALNALVDADRAAGKLPCAIVCTVGTTSTTAIDPVDKIASVARAQGLWLHVDGAMGGSAMVLPEMRAYWKGIEEADSVVVNPHKWMGIASDCSLYYVRDPEHLIRVMSTNPSYLKTAVDGDVINYRDWGIPLGRRFRALKIWFMLRLNGAQRIRDKIRRDCTEASWLAEEIRSRARWRVIAPVTFQTVCVRHEPEGLAGEALDAHTLKWSRAINESGFAFVTPSTAAGRWMVRVSIGAELTERADLKALWQAMQHHAEGT